MKKTITLLLCTFATSGLMAQGNTSWIAAGIDRVQMRDVPVSYTHLTLPTNREV